MLIYHLQQTNCFIIVFGSVLKIKYHYHNATLYFIITSLTNVSCIKASKDFWGCFGIKCCFANIGIPNIETRQSFYLYNEDAIPEENGIYIEKKPWVFDEMMTFTKWCKTSIISITCSSQCFKSILWDTDRRAFSCLLNPIVEYHGKRLSLPYKSKPLPAVLSNDFNRKPQS